MAIARILLGVSLILLTVGAVSSAVPEVAALVGLDHEVASVLWVDRHFVSIPLLAFWLDNLDTGLTY